MPGRRQRTLELATDIERRGFTGIYGPSIGDCVAMCQALASVTEHIPFGTTVQPIYLRHPIEMARTASFIHELSGGRFALGIGVSHQPAINRLGVQTGKPLEDIRSYVSAMRAAASEVGPLPPIVLATLRDKMLGLAMEIAEGAVWANASRSSMAAQLARVGVDRADPSFLVGNMAPTVIDDEDPAAAAAVCRKILSGYVSLPNYRNYWKACGYVEEMEAVEKALANGERDRLSSCMSDTWLRDVTLHGTTADVRDGVAAWFEAGVKTLIVVPSSTKGGQLVALEELFKAFE